MISFSRDHHFGLLLVWKIRQGLKKDIAPERISKYVLYFFKEDLEKHFSEEEHLLFCKLEVDDPFRTRAESDHFAVRRLIELISGSKNTPALLNQLADLLETHIRFEERELFNRLQETMIEEDLARIANRLVNNGQLVDEKWEDPFWDTK